MSEPLQVGKKYAFNGNSTHITNGGVYIFLGLQDDNTGLFTKDDQVLFDVVKAPYSQDVIKEYIDINGIDGLRELPNAILCNLNSEDGLPQWVGEDSLIQQIADMERALKDAKITLSNITSFAFYDTDCPNGDVYNDFIDTFETKCKQAGLSVDGYTIHGELGSNSLSVCHNNCATTSKHTTIFFELCKEKKYQRLNAGYMLTTNKDIIKSY